jgi:hypothetical protein
MNLVWSDLARYGTFPYFPYTQKEGIDLERRKEMKFQFVKSNGGSRLSRVLVVATLLGLLTLALVLA